MPFPSEARPLRILLICPHEAMRARFQEAVEPLGDLAVLCHTLAEYPTAGILARCMRLYAPDAVALSFERADYASAVMRFLEAEVRGLPVIGIHATSEPSILLQAMQSGTREFLSMPFPGQALQEGLRGVRRVLGATPVAYTNTEHIYSFLPAKPGAGATTLAMNVSAAVARRAAEQQWKNARVLLADLDLSCGMLRFLLKLPAGSIMDAILRSADMDMDLWRQTVIHRDGVDVLHSGGLDPQAHLDPYQVQCMIDFARKDYKFMCFDMSGNLEQYSLQVMGESKEIFIVTTPDRISLQLARDKLACLAKAGLLNRVSLILNRCAGNRRAPRETIEALVGAPVRAAFADRYSQVEKAIMAATWVAPKSGFGMECADFARLLLGEPAPEPRTLVGILAEAGH